MHFLYADDVNFMNPQKDLEGSCYGHIKCSIVQRDVELN